MSKFFIFTWHPDMAHSFTNRTDSRKKKFEFLNILNFSLWHLLVIFGKKNKIWLRMFDCSIRVKNAIKINFITAVTNYLHYLYNELYMLLICDILRKWLGYITECYKVSKYETLNDSRIVGLKWILSKAGWVRCNVANPVTARSVY